MKICNSGRHRRTSAVVGLISLLLLTASCGNSVSAAASVKSSASAGGTTAASGLVHAKAQVKKYSATPIVAPPPSLTEPESLAGKTIWYIPITGAADSLAGMGADMEQALSHVGASVHVCDARGLPTTVSSCMNTAAQQGAAAVVTSYIDYQMVPTSFQALVAKKIPVLVGAASPPLGVTPSPYLRFLSSSAQTDLFSTLMADLTIVRSGGKAHVIVIKLTDSEETLDASNKEIAEFRTYCPGCTVNAISTQTATFSKLQSTLSAALVAHPGTDYVTVPTDALDLPLALGAVRSAGFSSKVKIVAADGGLAGLQDVAAGTVAYDPGSPVEWAGWQYANAAIRMLANLPIEANSVGPTKIFDSVDVKQLALTQRNYLSTSWYGISKSAFQHIYLNAWKVK